MPSSSGSGSQSQCKALTASSLRSCKRHELFVQQLRCQTGDSLRPMKKHHLAFSFNDAPMFSLFHGGVCNSV